MNSKRAFEVVVTLTLASCATGAADPKARPAPVEESRGGAPEAELAQGQPAHGGKPQPPVDVALDNPASVPGNSDLRVTAKVSCRLDCTHLTVEVRGVDGLSANSSYQDHGSSPAGSAVEHRAVVHVPPEVVGLVVVDVSMQVNGKKYSTSRTFPLSAEGAVPNSPAPTGRIEADAQGKKVEVLPAVESRAR